MKEDYMLHCVENWCKFHNFDLYVDGTVGSYVLVDNYVYYDNICHDLHFCDLISLYNYIVSKK